MTTTTGILHRTREELRARQVAHNYSKQLLAGS
jgi:hypothetical protein